MARRELSSQAAAAKMIKQELKAAFPTTTFKVTSSSFSMGDDVSIHWTDGPTTDQVEKITNKYQRGHFDGMIDLYEYTNKRDDIPQSKYVMTQRDRSNEAFRAVVEYLNRTHVGYALVIRENRYGDSVWYDIDGASDKPIANGGGWQSQEIHRIMQRTPFVCAGCHGPSQVGDTYCPSCGSSLTEKEAA